MNEIIKESMRTILTQAKDEDTRASVLADWDAIISDPEQTEDDIKETFVYAMYYIKKHGGFLDA